jgi:tricorn protease-like protein
VLTSSGAKVAYDVKENGSYVIYWMDRTRWDAQRLCNDCGFVRGWSQTEDGLLASRRGTILKMMVPSGEVTKVLEAEGQILDDAEWSPDGRWIAFTALVRGAERVVYVAPASGRWLSRMACR